MTTLAATRTRPGLLLTIVLTAQFMALLDVFIVNVAAPTIQGELHATGGELQLIIAGYTIAYAVLLITGARLGGRYGPGRLFLVGLAVFTAASLACGLAGGIGTLVAARFVQGTGAALMLPQVLSLIQRTFTGRSRVRALTGFAAVLATGAAAGQIAGGVLVSADLFGWSWRSVFLVNVPIGVALLVLAARGLPLERPNSAERARGLDPAGLLTLTAAVTLTTVPLVLGQENDWPAWCWLSFAAAAALLAVLLRHESRLAAGGGEPLIAPRVLTSPGMPLATLRIFLSMTINGGNLFVLSLHVQAPEAIGGLGYGALRAGLVFLPTALAFGAVSLLWRRVPAHRQPVLPAAGLLLSCATALAGGLLLRDGGDIDVPTLTVLALGGAGLALAYSPTLTAALARVRPEDAADASGITMMTTQLGMLTGVAAVGTLYLDRLDLWPPMVALAAVAATAAAAGAVARGVGRVKRR
ncbi:MFS transporter [Streptomyces hainanensis]|uniref:MFS transporter n=1 Tax=Streptomyces hainanensis TaxID=402648 RepID=A0A4R4TCH7_9ACTN|nr:MFS transporter [Streptomyces hainanensis]TDC72842.1 MFS transporter [Streptomyces hainanensis]